MRISPTRPSLLMSVFLITVLLASCDNNPAPSTPTPPPSPPAATPAATLAPTERPVSQNPAPTITTGGTAAPPTSTAAPPAGTPVPAAPSSADKIRDAEAAGTLDHDTALLYQLYAAFDP